MNQRLLIFARETLKQGLSKLRGEQHSRFKRMYAFRDWEKQRRKDPTTGGYYETQADETMSLEEIVENIPEVKLDWANQQVKNTIKRLGSPNNGVNTDAKEPREKSE
jgi:hypothetical protein